MKKPLLYKLLTLLAIALITFAASPLSAQTSVKLKINHHLAGADFNYFQGTSNDLGNSFDVKRLEYYISEIKLIHDGGMETKVDDFFILAEASEELEHDLGMHMVTTIEGIKFSIGVEPAYNHLDPATYPADHPLAPQLPSMHWGWASGYRFVAMEGKSGSTLDQTYEIHALGDVNYFEVDLSLGATNDGSGLLIDVYADYSKALSGIDVSSGLIEHSEVNESADLLANFRDAVFSATAPPPVSGLNEIFAQTEISLYPNPTTDGNIVLHYESPAGLSSQLLRITDITGKTVMEYALGTGLVYENIHIENAGTYLLTVIADGKAAFARQLIVSE